MKGHDTEDIELHHQHAWRLIHKILNHRELIDDAEEWEVDDAEIILVAYGTPSRVVKSAVAEGRLQGLRVGGIRLISLWPFQDKLFQRDANYLVVELNWDGQLVREVERAARGNSVHFWGRCGELPTVTELLLTTQQILEGTTISREAWKTERWSHV
ncbi:MAG: hypothetical protein FDX21_08505 [Chlorobium sp.]|nr:MAG: hypothetical protein FDX21_08505 [Chlorobium sp.]